MVDFERQKEKALDILNSAEWVFCLDFNIFHRTKNFENPLYDFKGIKVLIDHHREPDTKSFDYGISNPEKSSTCEMVYDLIMASDNENLIDENIASCLYAGLISDTGSFKFTCTTPAVHQMAARLMVTGINHTEIHSNLFDNFLENRIRFIGHVLTRRLEFFYEYNTALIAIPKHDILKYEIKTGNTEGLFNYPHAVQGIKLVRLVIDRDEERKWSFRSKGDFDCNEFARKYFNGGGHFNAAGGSSKDSLEQAVAAFKQALKENEQILQ